MPVKGKGALFTELSTGNGDNVVPVPLQNSGAKFRGNIASGTVTVRQEPVLRQGVDSEKVRKLSPLRQAGGFRMLSA